MRLHKTCPLTSKDCNVNCAWNVGSEVKPQCAVARISLDLSSIEDKSNN